MSFVFWKIVFFSIIPLASASIVDKSYTTNREDVYDAILNTLFPIAFVVLAKVSGESGKIKKTLLPILDDLLYNTVTWVIPLIVSISYDDSLSIKIFSLVNMGLHVVCAAIALIQNKKISDKYELFDIPFCFLMSFPVIFIPIFWIVYIRIAYLFDPIGILFITLFGILLVLAPVYFIVRWFYVKKYSHSYGNNVYIGYVHAALMALMFYAPNILQTFLIVLYWPISFYFVKSCIFILVLSLTRNISYFTDKVPDDYLATSTTYTQYLIKDWVKFNFTGSKQEDNVMSAVMKKIEENEKEIKRMIRDNEDEINRLKEIMMNKGIGDRGGEKDTTITVIQ